MRSKIYAISILTVCFISCNNGNEQTNSGNSDLNDSAIKKEMKHEATFNSDSVINKLQGKWKETEYPYRVAHFKNSTVKFIEEGIIEEPTFREFTISQKCSFTVNNIKNAKANDIFLVMADRGTCDIINVTGDTLTLGGFSVNTNEDYKIIYRKTE